MVGDARSSSGSLSRFISHAVRRPSSLFQGLTFSDRDNGLRSFSQHDEISRLRLRHVLTCDNGGQGFDKSTRRCNVLGRPLQWWRLGWALAVRSLFQQPTSRGQCSMLRRSCSSTDNPFVLFASANQDRVFYSVFSAMPPGLKSAAICSQPMSGS